MSYLLEMLGRGLLTHMSGAFAGVLPAENGAALEALAQGVRDCPGDLQARLRLGAAQLRANRLVAARQTFDVLVTCHPSCVPALVGMACAQDELGNGGAALELLRRAQKLDPGNAAILFALGFCHEKSGATSEAAAYYRDAVMVCPSLRNGHERLAAIAVHAQCIDDAIEHYEKLCDLDPHLVDLHLTLAGLLARTGRHDDAI